MKSEFQGIKEQFFSTGMSQILHGTLLTLKKYALFTRNSNSAGWSLFLFGASS